MGNSLRDDGTFAGHQTVLLKEAVDALAIRADGVYVDGTFGRGGHSAGILASLGDKGRLVAIDRDPQAVEAARHWPYANDARFSIVHARFSQLHEVLGTLGVKKVDGILLDLGVSSPQLDQATRGFSFKQDGPLDMRMDPTQGISVAKWLEDASVDQITEVLRGYGEERFAFQIAKAIDTRRVESRGSGRAAFETTGELAAVVAGVVRRFSGGKGNRASLGKDPATRSFQALRIFINQEFEELSRILELSLDCLLVNGRLSIISFHSLEDRIVKQFLAKHSGKSQWQDQIQQHSRDSKELRELARFGALLPDTKAKAQLDVGKKILPSDAECEANPRARSAVLRSAMRLEAA